MTTFPINLDGLLNKMAVTNNGVSYLVVGYRLIPGATVPDLYVLDPEGGVTTISLNTVKTVSLE